jgi:hypothetical protein
VIGKYREVSTSRELAYVEEKGGSCASQTHRRKQTLAGDRGAGRVIGGKSRPNLLSLS